MLSPDEIFSYSCREIWAEGGAVPLYMRGEGSIFFFAPYYIRGAKRENFWNIQRAGTAARSGRKYIGSSDWLGINAVFSVANYLRLARVGMKYRRDINLGWLKAYLNTLMTCVDGWTKDSTGLLHPFSLPHFGDFWADLERKRERTK